MFPWTYRFDRYLPFSLLRCWFCLFFVLTLIHIFVHLFNSLSGSCPVVCVCVRARVYERERERKRMWCECVLNSLLVIFVLGTFSSEWTHKRFCVWGHSFMTSLIFWTFRFRMIFLYRTPNYSNMFKCQNEYLLILSI